MRGKLKQGETWAEGLDFGTILDDTLQDDMIRNGEYNVYSY